MRRIKNGMTIFSSVLFAIVILTLIIILALIKYIQIKPNILHGNFSSMENEIMQTDNSVQDVSINKVQNGLYMTITTRELLSFEKSDKLVNNIKQIYLEEANFFLFLKEYGPYYHIPPIQISIYPNNIYIITRDPVITDAFERRLIAYPKDPELKYIKESDFFNDKGEYTPPDLIWSITYGDPITPSQ